MSRQFGATVRICDKGFTQPAFKQPASNGVTRAWSCAGKVSTPTAVTPRRFVFCPEPLQNIDATTHQLDVKTWGILPYSQAELDANPGEVTGRTPVVVSEFVITPMP